jgi:AcrR family transcriptional regulator
MSLIPRSSAAGRPHRGHAQAEGAGGNRAQHPAAALDEFAARGFKGASMDAIAARTHTTRALINYYFGSKEKLYLAVLEHVYAEIRQAESQLDLDHLAPVAAIRRIVRVHLQLLPRARGLRAAGGAENQARAGT